MSAERCEKCDREECGVAAARAALFDNHTGTEEALARASGNCDLHRVDWRARAIAAESERDRERERADRFTPPQSGLCSAHREPGHYECSTCYFTPADWQEHVRQHLEEREKETARADRAERECIALVKDYGPFAKRASDSLADEVAALVRRRVIDSRSPAADALLDYRDPPSSPRADRLAELESDRDSLRAELNRYKSAAPVVNSVVGEQNTTIEALRAELLAANANTAARKVDYIQVRGHLAVLRKVVHNDNVTNQCTGDAGCWCDDCNAERKEESGWELPAVVKATAQWRAMGLARAALTDVRTAFGAEVQYVDEALAALAAAGVK